MQLASVILGKSHSHWPCLVLSFSQIFKDFLLVLYIPFETWLLLQAADLVIEFEQYVRPLLVLNFSNGQWSTIAFYNSSDEQEVSWLLLRCIWVMNVATIWVFWCIFFHFFENFLPLCFCLCVRAFNSFGQMAGRCCLGWQDSTYSTSSTCRCTFTRPTIRFLQLTWLYGWWLFGEGTLRWGKTFIFAWITEGNSVVWAWCHLSRFIIWIRRWILIVGTFFNLREVSVNPAWITRSTMSVIDQDLLHFGEP